MLFQPSNIAPSTLSGIGIGTVDVTKGIDVSWQVNGDSPMTDYQITIYKNDTASTQMYTTGQITLSEPFQTHDVNGNPMFFSTTISAATLATAGIVNGYANGYKMIIKQWWGANDYVEQTSAAVFITRTTPTLSIDAISSPVTTSSTTITATYAQAQGDPISTVEWVFALAGLEDTPIKQTGAINTQILSFNVDGLITGNTYSVMCNVVTSSGMDVSTGYVQFSVSYASTQLDGDYQVAQLCNSSASYLSWKRVQNNVLSYPYYDSTKTTGGITFTVNGEGDITANGTTTEIDAYFTLAEGTISDLGLTAGEKLIVTSGYKSARIVIEEKNDTFVILSSVEGNDTLQYVVPQTSNILSFSIKIPAGMSVSNQKISPMLYVENNIETVDNATITINPNQSLNGYSSPWVGGTGNNLADISEFKTISSGTTSTVSNGELTVVADGTASNQNSRIPKTVTTFEPGTYYVKFKITNATIIDGVSSIRFRRADTDSVSSSTAIFMHDGITEYSGTITLTSSAGYYLSCWMNGSDETATSVTVYDLIVSKTDVPYEPYSNICPIVGNNSISVYRTGKNLLPKTKRASSTTNGVQITVNDDGTILLNGTASANIIIGFPTNPETLDFPNGEYVLSGGVASNIYITLYDGTDNTGIRRSCFATPVSFTLTSGHIYAPRLVMQSGATANNVTIYPMLRASNTDSAYEAPVKDTYTAYAGSVSTVYGGTLDMVSGILTVDRKLLSTTWNLGTREETYGDCTRKQFIFSNTDDKTKKTDAICNVAKYISADTPEEWSKGSVFSIDDSNNYMFLSLPTSTDETTSIQLCYYLANPITYHLTPQKVTELAETNSIWSNVGNISVTYTNKRGAQSTISGSIVAFDDSNATIIPNPKYRPQVSTSSIYRYAQGEPILHRVYDFADNTSQLLDYFAPSQSELSYLIVAHGHSGDVFVPTNTFNPVFWFYSILLCSQDSNGIYHVRNEYAFKYGVETGAVSNNNSPTLQQNFTRYPTRQPVNSLYKTGTLKGYIGTVTDQKLYTDSVSLQNAIYNISTSTLTKFLKTRKGETIMVECSSPIQMQTGDNMVQQPLVATIDWVEVGDCSDYSIVSVPTDGFWPL